MSTKKTVSNTFTVSTVEDGESAPYYFLEWFAWSNDQSTNSVTTAPTIGGTWATSIPAQGSYAYLWRKSIRYVWNENTRQYSAEAAQYFRMSGLDGTSIKTRGQVASASQRGNGTATLTNGTTITMSDGDAVTQLDNGHLYQWVTEGGGVWIDLGQFKGENGVTYYTHIAWATNVNYNSSGVVTSVDGFALDKSPNDTTHTWMGTYVDTNSGQDSANASLYTWSNTKGVQGNKGDDAVRYELVPSVNVITLSEDEVPIFDYVFFSLYRTIGSNNPTIYSTVQQWQNGLFQLYYVVDGVQTEVDYDYMLSYDTKVNYHDIEYLYDINHDVTWVVKKNNSVVAQLNMGVVKNGEKGDAGKNAFVVDLENEMTNVALDENGDLIADFDMYFKVRAYYGTTNVLSDSACAVSASCSDPDVTITDTNAKTTGIRVQISNGIHLLETTEVSVTVTHTTYGTRTVIFTLAGVCGGENAVLQELLPTLDAISFARTAAGGLTPSSRDLTLSIKKTQGGSTSTQSISDSGLTIRWSSTSMPASKTGGNGWGNGTATGISWNNLTMQIANTVAATNIYIAAFNSDGTLVDRETIPVIMDGANGTSPYFADLNNEMDAIQCKHDGSVIAEQTVSTVISMWKGSAVEAFVIDNIYRNGTQLMWDGNNNGVWPRVNGSTVLLEFTTSASITNIDDFKITIHSYNDNTVTRELHFTINGVRANAIYRLVPSHSQIVKKKDGTYEPSENVTCSVEKTENGSTSTPDASEYTLEKSVNGGSYTTYSATAASSITSDLKFRLTVGGVVMDLETIPLVSDGNNGDGGVSYCFVFTKAAARVDENNTVTAELAGYAYKYVGGVRSALVSTTIRYGYILTDSDTYADTTTNSSGFFDAGTWFDGDDITEYGKNSPSIFAAIVIGGTVVHAEMITISVKGGTGNRGKMGRFFYYAGEFDSSNTTQMFVVNDAQAPYFSHGVNPVTGLINCHVYNPTSNGTFTMAQMWANSNQSWNNEPWEVMTNDFKYLITEAIFSNFAKLARAIFSGDWMLSQYGVPSRVISDTEKNLVYRCVKVDGQYPVSVLATLLDDVDLWEEYKDYGYSDDELETVADICKWAVSAMPNNSDDVRYDAIQAISTTSYQLFGLNQSNLFSVFEPNISFDFLRGKAYLNDCNVKGNLTGRVSTPFTRIKNSSDWDDYGVETTDDFGYTRDYLFINGMPTWNVQVEFMSGTTKVIRRLILPVITRETLGVEIKIVNVSGYTITVEGKPESSTYMSYGSYLLDGIQTTGYSNDKRTVEMDNQTMLKFVSVEIPTQDGEYGWIAVGEPQTIKSLV